MEMIAGFLLVLLTNIVFSMFIGSVGKEKGINFWRTFFVSFFMGPVVGLVYVLVKCAKNENLT